MKHLDSSWTRYQNDSLVVRYRRGREDLFQGKRVSKDCPLSAEERRLYVRKGAPSALRVIANRLRCSLTEALEVLNKARY